MASIATFPRADSTTSLASTSSLISNSSAPNSYTHQRSSTPDFASARSSSQQSSIMPPTTQPTSALWQTKSSFQQPGPQTTVASSEGLEGEKVSQGDATNDYPETPVIEPKELAPSPPTSPHPFPANQLRREDTCQKPSTGNHQFSSFQHQDSFILPPPRPPSPGSIEDEHLPVNLRHTRRAVRHGIKVRDFAFPETDPVHTGTADPSTLSYVTDSPSPMPNIPLSENPILSKLIPGYIGARKALALGIGWQNPFVDHGLGPRVLDCQNTPGWEGSPALNPNYGIPTYGKKQQAGRPISPHARSTGGSSHPRAHVVEHPPATMDEEEARRQLDKLHAMKMKRERSEGDAALKMGRVSKLAKTDNGPSEPRARSSSPMALDETVRRPRRPTNGRRPSNAIFRDSHAQQAESDKGEEMEVVESLGLDVVMSSPRLPGVS